MNQLIMNSKPLLTKAGMLSTTNLSKYAQQYLFPVRDHKLLLMSKEMKDRNDCFANAKISVKVCEVKNLVLPPTKQKSTDQIESTLTATPTKQSNKAESAQKITPKKESKEEKKDVKTNKKNSFGSFGKKNDNNL
jgi:hypothetical protein